MTPESRPIRDQGDLFTRCHRRWGLEPDEVLALLGLPRGGGYLGDFSDAYRRLEAMLELRSGRVLRPEASLLAGLDEAERKAWRSLAEYKFQRFGYWASIWVHLNRVSKAGRRDPFAMLVREARNQRLG